MNTEDTTSFVFSYGPRSKDRISFAWNQKHAREFVDENDTFRQQVIAKVVAEPGRAGGDLVADLFEAEARWSKEAWCVRDSFSALATILLKRGGAEGLDRFVQWVGASMDTYCQCHAMNIDPVALAALISEVEGRLREATDDRQKARLEMVQKLLAALKSGDPMAGMVKLGPEQLKGAEVKVVAPPGRLLGKIKSLFRKR